MYIRDQLAIDEDFTVTGGATLNFYSSYTANTPTYLEDLGGGTFSVASGCTLGITSPNGIGPAGSSYGNISNIGTRTFDPGATYNYIGYAAQTTGTGLPSSLTGSTGNLTINNSNGVTLSQTTTVSGTGALTLTAGKLTTSTYEMGIATTASLTGYNSSKYIIGNLRRYINASGTYDYPIGTSSNYELGTLSFNSQTGIASVLGYFTSGQSGTSPVSSTCVINGSPIGSYLNNGFWTFTPNTSMTGGTYDVTLNATGYTNATINGVAVAANRLGVIKRANGTSPWLGCGRMGLSQQSATLGTHSNSTQSISSGTATAKRTGVGAFSDFGIGLPGNNYALPVTFLYLTATAIDNSYIRLDWATASEINNKGFELQRSLDGVTFEDLSWTDGHGNSNQTITYSYDDKTVAPNTIYYYRIKQIDIDGDFQYSDIVSATIFTGKTGLLIESLRPNPATDKVNIAVVSIADINAVVSLTDMLGREVITQNWHIEDGYNGLDLDTRALAAGAYNVVLKTDNQYYTKKLVIAR